MFRQPIIIDLKGIFVNDDDELITRHARYGVKVAEMTEGQITDLVVLSCSRRPTGSSIHVSEGLRVTSIGKPRTLHQVGKAAARAADGMNSPITWIASTPFLEAVVTYLANRGQNDQFQVQVHGDFSNLRSFQGSPREAAKRILVSWALRRAQSIRAVSPIQASNLSSSYRVDIDKFFVAPVPIGRHFFEVDTGPAPKSTDRPVVGYFGRLHAERGLDLWVKTAHDLARMDSSLRFLVIGNGPERARFEADLNSQVDPSRTDFTGELRGPQLVKAINSLSVVLNTCSIESFGRSTLESLVLGTPVVSVASPGSQFIGEVFSCNALTVCPEADLAQSLLKAIANTGETETTDIVPKVKSFEDKNIERLVRSWL